MKALLLDGSREGQSLGRFGQLAEQELRTRGYEVETLVLSSLKIAPCKGCFGCWTATPGLCATDDDGRNVARKMISCDLVLMLTPVTFGGYSSELKKALDRSICVALPFLTSVGGSTRHPMRYKHYPEVRVAGVLPKADPESEKIFNLLIERNSRNFHTTGFRGTVFVDVDRPEIQNEIRSFL
jgi:multimeric flavodoxin WrbA